MIWSQLFKIHFSRSICSAQWVFVSFCFQLRQPRRMMFIDHLSHAKPFKHLGKSTVWALPLDFSTVRSNFKDPAARAYDNLLRQGKKLQTLRNVSGSKGFGNTNGINWKKVDVSSTPPSFTKKTMGSTWKSDPPEKFTVVLTLWLAFVSCIQTHRAFQDRPSCRRGQVILDRTNFCLRIRNVQQSLWPLSISTSES